MNPLTGSHLFDLMLRNLVTHPQSPDVGFSHQPSMLAATFSLLEVWSLAASGADLASLVPVTDVTWYAVSSLPLSFTAVVRLRLGRV